MPRKRRTADDFRAELDGRLSPLELQRIVRMPEASRLSGLSEDSLKRNHKDKIIRLSPRRIGMRLGDVLQLKY